MAHLPDRSQYSRRSLLAMALKGSCVAVISAGVLPLVGCSDDNKKTQPTTGGEFKHGIASGDPLANAVILWTRITPLIDSTTADDILVNWEVATDNTFKNIVNAGAAQVTASHDYTLKVDAQNLQPATVYYYRFSTATHLSVVGTTKTLPKGAVAQVKLAVVSCSNYPAGYFHVYAEIAKQKDFDVVLHLGDYIYEYARTGYASEDAASMGRQALPEGELLLLNDYRARYAQYRTDKDLQAAHACAPFITVWDDHEIANDSWREGAENHNAGEGEYQTRLLAALKAYAEWMPIRPPVDSDIASLQRSFQFGDLVNLTMLDTRLAGRDKQLNLEDYFSAGSFNAQAYAADIGDSSRTLLGVDQREWLFNQLTLNATWQVLGQQVLMGRMELPMAVATQQLTLGEFAALAQLAQTAATTPELLTSDQLAYVQEKAPLLQLGTLPYNQDAWDGYPIERQLILKAAKDAGINLIVLAGDTHNAWVNQLSLDDKLVGVEWGVSSVTSPGLESYLGLTSEADVMQAEAALVALIGGLKYVNLSDRGYMVATFTPDEAISEFYFVDNVKTKDYYLLVSRHKTMRVAAGHNKVE